MLISLAHALKLFLPSWNFFDDFSATPRLEFRTRTGNNDGPADSDWQLLHASHSTRSVGRTFFNPRGNAELFELALVETAADELKAIDQSQRRRFLDSDAWSRLAPLLMRRTSGSLQKSPGILRTSSLVQFRLRLTTRSGDPDEWFETPWLSLGRTGP